MKNDSGIGNKVDVGIIGVLILATAAAVLDGWVLKTVWGWFIVPLFSLPQIPLAYAVGLRMAVAAIFNRVPNDDESSLHYTIVALLTTLAGFGFVWLVHLFV